MLQREETGRLRLFCICGQKMRVSDDMYGRPGKCIACRQKIRIPRRDEVPRGVTEIHLKDHPEFLRRSSPRKVDLPKVAGDGVETPIPVGPDGEETLSTVPLDILEPLRVVCSITHKVEQRLLAMKRAGGMENEIDRAEWQGYLARAQSAREDLEEQLRQRLMEVAIELAATQEKIAEAGLSVRVGEMDYAAFRETTGKLRQRRDRLERRQANLRGWLNTHDPYIAGGYVDVSVDQIPGRGLRLSLPSEPEAPGSPLQIYIEELRSALEMRERADRKLIESARLEKEGAIPEQGLAHSRAELLGIKRRGVAAIDFAKGRLQQLLGDYDGDLKSISAQMDLARGRLQIGEIDRNAFDRIEKDLLRTRADIAKARGIVRRAIAADASRNVPAAAGTFIQRLGAAKTGDEIPADAWVAWAGAVALLVTVVLPFVDNTAPVNIIRQQAAPNVHWLASLPAGAAVLAIAAAFVPQAVARGFLFLVIWAAATLGALAFYVYAGAANTPLGQTLRANPPFEAGALVYLLGIGLIAVAAGIALVRFPRARWVFAAAVLAVGAAAAALLTTGEAAMPAPELTVLVPIDGAESPATSVALTNRANKALAITRNPAAPEDIDFLLERKVGSESWQPIDERTVLVPGSPAIQGQSLAPLATAEFAFALTPGVYRVSVEGPALDAAVLREFTVEPVAPAPPLEDPAASAVPGSDPGAGAGSGVTVSLDGVIQTSDFPQFSITVRTPEGEEHRRRLSLTDQVYGDWQIEEFDPGARTVVLKNADEILIVQQGAAVELPH